MKAVLAKQRQLAQFGVIDSLDFSKRGEYSDGYIAEFDSFVITNLINLLKRQKRCEYMTLSNTSLSDHNFAKLANYLKEDKNIKYLDVSCNRLTDSSWQELADLTKQNINIVKILVLGNGFSVSGFRKLDFDSKVRLASKLEVNSIDLRYEMKVFSDLKEQFNTLNSTIKSDDLELVFMGLLKVIKTYENLEELVESAVYGKEVLDAMNCFKGICMDEFVNDRLEARMGYNKFFINSSGIKKLADFITRRNLNDAISEEVDIQQEYENSCQDLITKLVPLIFSYQGYVLKTEGNLLIPAIMDLKQQSSSMDNICLINQALQTNSLEEIISIFKPHFQSNQPTQYLGK